MEQHLTTILLASLGFLVVALIRRLEKGNETLVEVNKNVAVILVELKAYDRRITANEREISSIRNKLHEFGNYFAKYDLMFEDRKDT